jgi:O-antigen/teichoic acid export membrane protein
VVLTKLTSSDQVGDFALGLAIAAPIILFANLSLRAAQATDTRRMYTFGDYLGLRVLTTGSALMIIAGIVAWIGYPLSTALVILGIGIMKSVEAISDVFYGLAQQHERMDRIAQSLVIRGIVSLIALTAAVYLTRSVVWGVIAMTGVWTLNLMTFDIPNGGRILRDWHNHLNQGVADADRTFALKPHWQPSSLKQLTLLTLPLGITAALISLISNIPNYFIATKSELGIFTALAYLTLAGNTVVVALGQSASPRLAQYYAAGNRFAFQKLLLQLIGIGVVLGAGAVIVSLIGGRLILTLFYTPEYARYHVELVWLMVSVGIGFFASFLGYGMTAARYFRVFVPLFLVVTAAMVAGCYWLIPRYGILGVAYAQIIVMILQVVGSLGVVVYALNHTPTKQASGQSEPTDEPTKVNEIRGEYK